MAKPMLIYLPKMQFFDNNGVPLAGGKVFIYQPGTTTKQNTYTDATLNTANPNPIILDSAGRPSNNNAPIDLYTTSSFKMVVAPSTDSDPPQNALWTEDNITTLGQLVSSVTKTVNYLVVVTDRDKLIKVDASGGAKTITLLPASTAGDGFNLKIKKIDGSTNSVTIQANAAETIDGTNTITIANPNDYVEMYCDGTQWFLARSVPITLRDTNGNIALQIVTAANAVNYLTVTDSATGSGPIVGSAGSDTNIDLNFQQKGLGVYNFNASSTSPAVLKMFEQTSNGVTYFFIQPPANLSGGSYGYVMPNGQASIGQHIRHSSVAGTLVHKSAVHFENMTSFTSSGTFNVPADVQTVYVECIGGGGGGGGNTSNSYTGCGGGGGAFACGIVSVTPGAAITVTVGTGGAGATSNTTGTGSTGNNSSFGTSVIAVAGAGGAGVTTGGAGGAAGSCTVPTSGYAVSGGTGNFVNSTGFIFGTGGAGARIGVTQGTGAGVSGIANTGGGGNGGTTAAAGGNGAAGLVIVWY